jgi:hypothetical protein
MQFHGHSKASQALDHGVSPRGLAGWPGDMGNLAALVINEYFPRRR